MNIWNFYFFYCLPSLFNIIFQMIRKILKERVFKIFNKRSYFIPDKLNSVPLKRYLLIILNTFSLLLKVALIWGLIHGFSWSIKKVDFVFIWHHSLYTYNEFSWKKAQRYQYPPLQLPQRNLLKPLYHKDYSISAKVIWIYKNG